MRTILKGMVLLIMFVVLGWELISLQGNLLPVELLSVSPAQQALTKMGIQNLSLANSYDFATQQTGISQEMLIALTHTESSFRSNAVSSKGYCGLMQIPQRLESKDAHVLEGATILKNKIRIADGDIRKALSLYKGYPVNDRRGQEQVEKVMKLYNYLREG